MNAPPSPPRWEVPWPYGYARAVETMGTIAAPILAGFAVTGAIEILASGHQSRWSEATLAFLIGAAALLIASFQFAFRARAFFVTPNELEAWWPDADDDQRQMVKDEQREHARLHDRWALRSGAAYNAGLLVLILGIGCALTPPGHVSVGRVIGLSVVALAFGAELTWILNGYSPELISRFRQRDGSR